MGGHDHHHEEIKIPDYRAYRVEDVPLLVRTQQALAAKGLKDPWLRNEVWRYNTKAFGTEGSRFVTTVFRGFKFGFIAFALTVFGTAGYARLHPSEDHEHGHDEH